MTPRDDAHFGMVKVNNTYPKVKLVHPDAKVPTRASSEDIGYDVTVVGYKDTIQPNVVMFETGISIEPPSGIYYELVARSSLAERGWIFANGVGVIDPGYRGELKIPLTQINQVWPIDLFGQRVAQLIPRKIVDTMDFRVVDELSPSQRGENGFGSTGKH